MFKEIYKIFFPVILLQIFNLIFTDITSAVFSHKLGNLAETIMVGKEVSNTYIIMFCFFFILSLVVGPYVRFLGNKLFLRSSLECDKFLFKRLLCQKPEMIITKEAGELSSKLINEQNELCWAIVDSGAYSIEFLLIPAMIIYIGIATKFAVAGIVFVMSIIQIYKGKVIGSIKSKLEFAVMDSENMLNQRILDVSNNASFILVNGLQKLVQPGLIKENEQFVNGAYSDAKIRIQIYDWLSNLLDMSCYIVLIVIFYYLEQMQLISIGMIITAIYVYSYIAEELENMIKYFAANKMKKNMERDLVTIVGDPIESCIYTNFDYLKYDDFFCCFGEKEIRFEKNEINKGDIVAICGENGSGKSTLLSYLLCLRFDSKMNYEINKKKILFSYVKKCFDFIDTEAELLCETVYDYLMSSGAMENEVRALAKRYELDNLLERNGDELSGGERKRIDIVRALLSKRAVMILDEPEVFLDSRWKEIISLDIYNSGKTCIYSTHDPYFLDIASKVVVI